ncbi:MAG: alpha/beta hydrolase [Chloroflexi bacterium]|nr:alpha/beta hydrolase [Chloroflexota bacterium]
MPLVVANGIEMQVTTEGSGPPLVLLHGASSSATEDWAQQRPLFRQSFTCHLVDARGHAGTRWDARDGWSRDTLVEDLRALADALGLETFHVAGFSMGAMTAITFATRWPERLRSAIIVGIDVQPEPRTSIARRAMDPERIEREEPAWAAQLERRHGPVQGPGAWRALMAAMAAEVADQVPLTPAELRGARAPSLLACGDRDPWVPLDHAVQLHRQLPDSRLLVVPDCTHVVPVRQPALFNAAALAFWRSIGALPGPSTP